MPANSANHSAPLRLEVAEDIYAMAQRCLKERDYFRAGRLLRQCLEIAPGHVLALINLAHVLYATGRIAASQTAYRRALKLAPTHPAVLRGIGNCYRAEGKFDKAILHYEKVLKFDPNNAESIYSLIMLGAHTRDAALALRLEAIHQSAGHTGLAKVLAGFSLARIHEAEGEHSRAFQYYAWANAVAFSQAGYDEAAHLAAFAQVTATFTDDLLRRLEHARCNTTKQVKPIFVLGMPRSGTSLVEQILASHSAVYGAGEVSLVPYIAEVLMPEASEIPFPTAMDCMDASALGEFADYVLQSLSSYAPERREYVVDKTPMNFLLVGLIRLMFPHSPIIHCVRDPMDTCWSMFRQYFMLSGHPYSYDQQALGRYYRGYQKLMDHWRTVLPGAVYDLEYERLIAEPAAVIRALLDHCHLPWEDGCLAFYRTRRVVSTASELQVRRPIFKTSIQSWLPVANQLAPLQAALDGR